jgi:hypothetical protein
LNPAGSEKDVTKYIPLFSLPEATLVMQLDNVIDKSSGIDGTFIVELSATYYKATPDFPASIPPAAFIPLSGTASSPFSIPTAASMAVQIPIVMSCLSAPTTSSF